MKSRSSHSASCSPKSGMFGRQKPQRLHVCAMLQAITVHELVWALLSPVYTIQPVAKPVVKRVSCKRGIKFLDRLSQPEIVPSVPSAAGDKMPPLPFSSISGKQLHLLHGVLTSRMSRPTSIGITRKSGRREIASSFPLHSLPSLPFPKISLLFPPFPDLLFPS